RDRCQRAGLGSRLGPRAQAVSGIPRSPPAHPISTPARNRAYKERTSGEPDVCAPAVLEALAPRPRGGTVDTADLKSASRLWESRFESGRGHQNPQCNNWLCIVASLGLACRPLVREVHGNAVVTRAHARPRRSRRACPLGDRRRATPWTSTALELSDRAVEGMPARPRTVPGRLISLGHRPSTAAATPCPHFAALATAPAQPPPRARVAHLLPRPAARKRS